MQNNQILTTKDLKVIIVCTEDVTKSSKRIMLFLLLNSDKSDANFWLALKKNGWLSYPLILFGRCLDRLGSSDCINNYLEDLGYH